MQGDQSGDGLRVSTKNHRKVVENVDHEFAVELANWLSMYTEDVIHRVMAMMDDMVVMYVGSGQAYHVKETVALAETIQAGYNSDAVVDRYRNHALTHAASYRDVLYDAYINELPF